MGWFRVSPLYVAWFSTAVYLTGCGSGSKVVPCSGLPAPSLKATSDYRLAYAQAGSEGANPYRIREGFSMADASADLGYNLTLFDAGNAADTQAAQITSMISDQYDGIFISPVDEVSAAPQIIKARQACIPVFLIDSDMDHSLVTPGKDYVTFVGADMVQQGNLIAHWLLNNVSGSLTVLELTGVSAAYSSQARQSGFDSVMAAEPRVSIVAKISDNFRRPQARASVAQAFKDNGSINVLFAHNDDMGLGAVDALTDPRNVNLLGGRSVGKTITLASVDGTLDVLKQISAGTYNVTLNSHPDVGTQALLAWQNYLAGAAVPIWTTLPTQLIDATNVAQRLSAGY